MVNRSPPIFFVILATIFYSCRSFVLQCDDTTSCAGSSYICTDKICQINCNTQSSCRDTYFRCDDTYLHGLCEVNCAGQASCEGMVVSSTRDTNIMCTEYDSCDEMRVGITGKDPNDKINATFTSTGGFTNNLYLLCSGDGIGECFLDCRDNGDYYSCIDMEFHCDTPGTCRFRCENSNACCGCTMYDMFFSYTYKNYLYCYEGLDNCIQEDPNTCSNEYGCISRIKEPTRGPTQVPSGQPTIEPTLDPTAIPTTATSVPTNAPTAAPTIRPTSNPTNHGATGHPSVDPTEFPTFFPSVDPTTARPTDDPTVTPTNNPSVPPTLSPTMRPTQYPTQDPEKAKCISIIESIENVIGVTADDFRTDSALQKYAMNSTKAVIYEGFKMSHIYDMNELCQDFWRCFFLKLKTIRGSTILDIDVCAWTQAVLDALFVKIEIDVEEMGAYMKTGLAWYLVDGPTYTGYDNVIINHATRVVFTLVTPSPTGSGHVDIATTDMDNQVGKAPDTLSDANAGASVGAVIAVIFVCACLLIIAWSWHQKNIKIKRELVETQQRVVDLEALTGPEGGGVGLDNIAPEDEEGAEGTVPMSSGYHETNSRENEALPSRSDEDMGPGSVVSVSGAMEMEMVAIPDAIPEDEEKKEEEVSSSSDNDEMDAMYVKKESVGDALYGPGTTTGGHEAVPITVGGRQEDSQSTDQE